ncbi:MAG: dihydrolipoyl dehydrogenase [Syntrophobacteraceae bacterium]
MAAKVAVIGAGPGGYVAAVRAAQLGAEVTVIEQDKVGGTCLNRGCIPSKIMITTAELLEKFHQAGEFGLRLEGKVFPDMQRLMARKEKVIQDQAKGILQLLDHHKIRYLRGKGIIEKQGLAVAQLEDGNNLEVPWDSLILAPGTQPFDFPAFPRDGEQVLSSDDALCLQEVPESIMILGGGVIGCEFAFLLSALGSRVSVVEALDRMLPLPSVDEDCSKVIQREMKKRKIQFMVKRTAQSVERSGGKLRVTIGPSPFIPDLGEREKQPLVVEVDKVLVCIGRRPCTQNMGLESIGVTLDPRGWIVADERMQTGVPGVYAVGDVLGPSKVMLAHVASMEGAVAAENAAGSGRSMDYGIVPGAIFTMPEVANVGLTEAQAREQGFPVRSDTVLFRTMGKAQVTGEIAGEAKIVSDAGTGRILGVHMVGARAADLIAEGTLALKMQCTVKDLAETIHAHPTLAEVMQEASLKAMDMSLHG